MSLDQKEKNPLDYLVKHPAWPPYYTGSLLAWLSLSLTEHGYRCSDIAYVTCYEHTDNAYTHYRFSADAFDIAFNSRGGTIKEIETHIERFVMSDGAVFVINQSDGERLPTELRYIAPVIETGGLRDGLGVRLRGGQ